MALSFSESLPGSLMPIWARGIPASSPTEAYNPVGTQLAAEFLVDLTGDGSDDNNPFGEGEPPILFFVPQPSNEPRSRKSLSAGPTLTGSQTQSHSAAQPPTKPLLRPKTRRRSRRIAPPTAPPS